ncbi:MAG: hypothetical protein ABSG85_15820, partial [Spirochaetia bacterium]
MYLKKKSVCRGIVGFLLLAMWAGSTPQGFAESTVSIIAVVRETAIDLNSAWRYKVVSQVDDSLFAPETEDSAWPTTQAPARWTDQGIERGDLTVAVYRRTVKVPAAWQGKAIGISAWFYPGSSMVYVNGHAVDPQGSLFALIADVSGLLRYGQDNLIAVSTTQDGIREAAQMDPPLLGPVGQKLVTK